MSEAIFIPPAPGEVRCDYCGSAARLANSLELLGRDVGKIWVCTNFPTCDAYVGAHKGTDEPMGRLANAELRRWKIRAHAVLDPLWKSKQMTRTQAYRLLARLMQLPAPEAHIGMFTASQCQQAINRLEEWINRRKRAQGHIITAGN